MHGIRHLLFSEWDDLHGPSGSLQAKSVKCSVNVGA